MSEENTIDQAELTSGQRFWKEWRGFFLFLGLMIFFRVAIADWNHVPSGSMRPNLIEGDRIWVNKLAYDIKVPYTSIVLKKVSEPARGDIVVFFAPNEERTRMVKRLIGLPGDKITVLNNVVTINGERLDYVDATLESSDAVEIDIANGFRHLEEDLPGRPHIMMKRANGRTAPELRSFSQTVPEGHYLMLGDNRDQSRDSRVWGFVPHDRIIGRSSTVVMSLRTAKEFFVPRGDRFFMGLN
ncbi:MAG: signal peptidase I [Gammaproteobacteria bacterium]